MVNGLEEAEDKLQEERGNAELVMNGLEEAEDKLEKERETAELVMSSLEEAEDKLQGAYQARARAVQAQKIAYELQVGNQH